MPISNVKRETNALIDQAVARQKLWMSRLRARGKALLKYLSKNTLRTMRTMTSFVKKQDDEVSAQSVGARLKYLAAVFVILGAVFFAGWRIFGTWGNAQHTAITAASSVRRDVAQVVETAKETIAGDQKGSAEYTIRRGDTLFDLARRFTGDGWNYRQVAKTNGIPNPDLIEVGQVLKIEK